MSLGDDVYNSNMTDMDGDMKDMLMFGGFFYFAYGIKYVKDTIKALSTVNPLRYPFSALYTIKFLKLLLILTVGNDGTKRWSRNQVIVEGLIYVCEDCKILFYNVDDRRTFEQVLLNYVMFDTPSSKGDKYATVKKINNNLRYMDLRYKIKLQKPEVNRRECDFNYQNVLTFIKYKLRRTISPINNV